MWNKHKRKWLPVWMLIMTLLLPGCAAAAVQVSAEELASRPIRAVATTGMVADLVRNVGGERVQVTALMGPGVDPHLYKASEGNVRQLAEADIIFYSGLHLEAGMARVLERVAEERRVVAVTDGVDRSLLMAPPQFAGAYDPHIWFDVAMWVKTVDIVETSLSELDPAHAEGYRQNASLYRKQLNDLHEYVLEQASRVPPEKRVLITAHDAFNYFGRIYGFEVRGLQGISTATEASTGDLQQLAKFIADRKIPAIFVETSVPQRSIEAVQAAVRARGFEVLIGGSLYSDAMGSPGTPDDNYIGMVKHNIDTIVTALLRNP